jgi:hypothetical protein
VGGNEDIRKFRGVGPHEAESLGVQDEASRENPFMTRSGSALRGPLSLAIGGGMLAFFTHKAIYDNDG